MNNSTLVYGTSTLTATMHNTALSGMARVAAAPAAPAPVRTASTLQVGDSYTAASGHRMVVTDMLGSKPNWNHSIHDSNCGCVEAGGDW